MLAVRSRYRDHRGDRQRHHPLREHDPRPGGGPAAAQGNASMSGPKIGLYVYGSVVIASAAPIAAAHQAANW